MGDREFGFNYSNFQAFFLSWAWNAKKSRPPLSKSLNRFLRSTSVKQKFTIDFRSLFSHFNQRSLARVESFAQFNLTDSRKSSIDKNEKTMQNNEEIKMEMKLRSRGWKTWVKEERKQTLEQRVTWNSIKLPRRKRARKTKSQHIETRAKSERATKLKVSITRVHNKEPKMNFYSLRAKTVKHQSDYFGFQRVEQANILINFSFILLYF